MEVVAWDWILWPPERHFEQAEARFRERWRGMWETFERRMAAGEEIRTVVKLRPGRSQGFEPTQSLVAEGVEVIGGVLRAKKPAQ